MVKIITDTTSCLPVEIALRYEIPVIPQIIHFGSQSYFEGQQIDIPTFLARLKTSTELPKTAAPPPELFVEEFKRLIPLGEPILCIHPSAEISGTVRAATVASHEFPEADIRIIDTRLIASPLGTLVQLAAEWAAQGQSADAIQSQLVEMSKNCRIYFMVETLEYLARGGRIGGAAALLGSMLQIKPILTLKDGRVDQYHRERTHKRAIAHLKELVLSQIARDGRGYLTIVHADAPNEAQSLAQELAPSINQSWVPIANMPPAIVTHAGPGVLGVGFFI